MTIRSYIVVIVAGKGVLLGGVKRHFSSRFASRADAESFMATSVEQNQLAGRDIISAEIRESHQKPEI